jgi:putative Holliday junction resolvase
LALDVGERRIGVAISDETRTLARPLKTMVRASLSADIQELIALLNEYHADTLVVGYPRSLSGEAGAQALQTKHYAEQLAAALPAPIILWDERYSTVEATDRLMAAGRRRRGDKGQIDAAAAAVILQDYLDTQRDANQ